MKVALFGHQRGNMVSFDSSTCLESESYLRVLTSHVVCISIFKFTFLFPRGERRSRRQCNTGPTRGERGASPCEPTRFQKSVNLEGFN